MDDSQPNEPTDPLDSVRTNILSAARVLMNPIVVVAIFGGIVGIGLLANWNLMWIGGTCAVVAILLFLVRFEIRPLLMPLREDTRFVLKLTIKPLSPDELETQQRTNHYAKRFILLFGALWVLGGGFCLIASYFDVPGLAGDQPRELFSIGIFSIGFGLLFSGLGFGRFSVSVAGNIFFLVSVGMLWIRSPNDPLLFNFAVIAILAFFLTLSIGLLVLFNPLKRNVQLAEGGIQVFQVLAPWHNLDAWEIVPCDDHQILHLTGPESFLYLDIADEQLEELRKFLSEKIKSGQRIPPADPVIQRGTTISQGQTYAGLLTTAMGIFLAFAASELLWSKLNGAEAGEYVRQVGMLAAGVGWIVGGILVLLQRPVAYWIVQPINLVAIVAQLTLMNKISPAVLAATVLLTIFYQFDYFSRRNAAAVSDDSASQG